MRTHLTWLMLASCADPVAKPPPTAVRVASDAPHVHWAPRDATGERAVFLDERGGALERALHDDDVATFLNDRYATIFFAPNEAPGWTRRFGAPSLVVLGPDGCVRATARPTTPKETIDVLNAAQRAKRDGLCSAPGADPVRDCCAPPDTPVPP